MLPSEKTIKLTPYHQAKQRSPQAVVIERVKAHYEVRGEDCYVVRHSFHDLAPQPCGGTIITVIPDDAVDEVAETIRALEIEVILV